MERIAADVADSLGKGKIVPRGFLPSFRTLKRSTSAQDMSDSRCVHESSPNAVLDPLLEENFEEVKDSQRDGTYPVAPYALSSGNESKSARRDEKRWGTLMKKLSKFLRIRPNMGGAEIGTGKNPIDPPVRQSGTWSAGVGVWKRKSAAGLELDIMLLEPDQFKEPMALPRKDISDEQSRSRPSPCGSTRADKRRSRPLSGVAQELWGQLIKPKPRRASPNITDGLLYVPLDTSNGMLEAIPNAELASASEDRTSNPEIAVGSFLTKRTEVRQQGRFTVTRQPSISFRGTAKKRTFTLEKVTFTPSRVPLFENASEPFAQDTRSEYLSVDVDQQSIAGPADSSGTTTICSTADSNTSSSEIFTHSRQASDSGWSEGRPSAHANTSSSTSSPACSVVIDALPIDAMEPLQLEPCKIGTDVEVETAGITSTCRKSLHVDTTVIVEDNPCLVASPTPLSPNLAEPPPLEYTSTSRPKELSVSTVTSKTGRQFTVERLMTETPPSAAKTSTSFTLEPDKTATVGPKMRVTA